MRRTVGDGEFGKRFELRKDFLVEKEDSCNALQIIQGKEGILPADFRSQEVGHFVEANKQNEGCDVCSEQGPSSLAGAIF